MDAPESEPAPAEPPAPAPEPSWPATFPDAAGTGTSVPGSYLPPSTTHRPGTVPPASAYGAPPPSVPAGPPAWAPPATVAPPAATAGWVPPTPGAFAAGSPGAYEPGPAGPPAAATAPREPRPTVPGRASILADLPFDAPDQLDGWLVALGGGLGILGFFLPWTASLGTGLDGYFGSWGLGITAHLPIFVFLVIVTALAVLPNRVAIWVRSGVCGMVGGGILFGIVWLYLGSDASQLGALLSAVAGILLIVGGVIAVAPGRAAHQAEDG